MKGQGHRIFADAVLAGARGAGEPARSRLCEYASAVTGPLGLVIRGRRGVGCRTVAAALRGAGYAAEAADRGTGPAEPDALDILVVAEALKPEDLRGPRPVLAVFNKADLAGFRPDGPMAAAQRRSLRAAARLGVPVAPLAALAAVAACDDRIVDQTCLDALRVLVDEPADLSSPDAFRSGPHRVPAALRRRLLAGLDLFGIAHAVVALRADPGTGVDGVRRRLRTVSGVDALIERIEAAGAPVRYRAMLEAVSGIQELAVGAGASARVAADLLSEEDLVLGRMWAAVDVVEAAGLHVDPRDEPDAHLERAVRWRRYAAGPVSRVHHACGHDIARGSLRLLASARESR